ncbi:hypothetical protein L1987_36139 [Smallanthus sonchifolius]|uniref:Uncharacterized protein n=1 Tax=Smallanthus sonchifolius TaxID=185202 RepID=A0ACB9HEE1_9ASTR|nr:hypothetical protein L1987_36139 [Smallanthus sonchifolius]
MILGRNSPLATFRVREPLIGENESGHGSPGGLDQKAQSLTSLCISCPDGAEMDPDLKLEGNRSNDCGSQELIPVVFCSGYAVKVLAVKSQIILEEFLLRIILPLPDELAIPD